MKRLISFALLALIACFVLSSCNKEADIYRTESKLWKIRYNSEAHTDSLEADEVFNYDDKDVLLSIQTFYNEAEEVNEALFNFEYNKDGTVSKITHTCTDYTEELVFSYNAKLLWRILYTIDGATRMETVITRSLDEKEKHLSKIKQIKEYYDEAFYRQFYVEEDAAPLFNRFMSIPTVPEKLSTYKSASFALKRVIDVTYDGNNISKTEENVTVEGSPELIQSRTIVSYSYDLASLNPFYGLNFAYGQYLGYSENNCTYRYYVTDEYVESEGLWHNLIAFEEGNTYSHFNEEGFPTRKTTIRNNGVPFRTYYYYLLDRKLRKEKEEE